MLYNLDTVDHNILLQRLSISFGLSGNILDWLTCYLQDRSSWWPMGPRGPSGSLLQLGCPRALSLALSFKKFTLLIWGPFWRLRLSWASPMQTTCKPIFTVWRTRPMRQLEQ